MEAVAGKNVIVPIPSDWTPGQVAQYAEFLERRVFVGATVCPMYGIQEIYVLDREQSPIAKETAGPTRVIDSHGRTIGHTA